MSGFRKFMGIFIIVFIGIPVLIGMIWAVGLTRAVVSSEFLSDLPKEIITKIPAIMDETLAAVDQEGVIEDENTRIWLRAMADVNTTPREMLEKIGVMNWLKIELTSSLDSIGKILRGEMRPQPVLLNMRPLKAALVHKDLDAYMLQVIKKLPPCTESDVQKWADAVLQGKYEQDLPPCQPPDPEKALEIVRQKWEKEVSEIPDTVNMFNVRSKHFFNDSGLDIARLVISVTYLLFLIPAIIIGLASLIGASSGAGVVRWMGYATLIGGGLTYGLSRFSVQMMQYGMGFGPTGYSEFHFHFPLKEVLFDKSGELALQVVNHLLTSVNRVSGIVCLMGIILIALSYLVFNDKKNQAPQRPKSSTGNTTPTPPPVTPATVEPTQVTDIPPALNGSSNDPTVLPAAANYPLDSGSQTDPDSK